VDLARSPGRCHDWRSERKMGQVPSPNPSIERTFPPTIASMPEPRFKPPSAHVQDPPRGKGSAVRGVVFGVLVDVGGTLLFGIVLGIVYAMFLVGTGRNEQEVQASLANSEANPFISSIGLLGGLAFSVLGGYVCERTARKGNYRLGIVLSCISAVLGLAVAWSTYSVPMHGLLVFLTVGSVLLGTRLGWERREV
jgi:hypothetical protein